MIDEKGDTLALVCCACPSDEAARAALGDYLRERGYELFAEALALLSPDEARNCFSAAWGEAAEMRLSPALWVVLPKIMWYCQFNRRMRAEQAEQETALTIRRGGEDPEG